MQNVNQENHYIFYITKKVYIRSKFYCFIKVNASISDIPLTPKELSLLTGTPGGDAAGVRASHSSESVLDAPDTPPPKPARPNRLYTTHDYDL